MAGKMCPLVLLFIVLCLMTETVAQPPHNLIQYSIQEELETHTLIGNVPTDARLATKYSSSVLQELNYAFLSQSSESEQLFAIEHDTGTIRASSRIDRDAICPGMLSCVVSLSVAISPAQYFEVIPIQIEIIDRNDNAPTYPAPEFRVSFLESVVPPASVMLPIPEDLDSPPNGVTRYQILPPTDMFEIRTQLRGVVLILKQHLDREVTDFHQIQIVAFDGGDPSLSGSVLVNISIQDANDNYPVFNNDTYTVVIPEDLSYRATVVTVSAHDRDINHNGQVQYSLTPDVLNRYGDIFGINSNTGEIFLKGILDASGFPEYHLVVRAQDGGIGLDAKSSLADVFIIVRDINDNAPQIIVNTLTDDNRARVSETADIGTFVAHIFVTDKDKDEGGQVTCLLNDTNFSIQALGGSQYKIITNNMFDREERMVYTVEVMCHDHGPQVLSSTYNLTVVITDVNDHRPHFNQTQYSASIGENNVADAYVLRVYASDRDQGINAQIQYSLDNYDTKYFQVDPDSGIIRAVAPLDYEEIQSHKFLVMATDRGPQSQTATATVTILVEDRNDMPPVFIQETYSFGIFENEAAGTEAGIVNAYDPDSSPYNAVEYILDAAEDHVKNSFSINRNTGRINTELQLDREIIPVYYLIVIAYNPDSDLSSTASVTVYVADDNDQPPTIDFPNEVNNTVSISNYVPFGYVVTRVRAHDEDIGNNAQVVFALIQGNEAGLFDMDHMTGAITVVGDLSELADATYNLSVEVMDQGEKPLTAISIAHIIVDSSIPHPNPPPNPSSTEPPNPNSVIVIAVGCVSGGVIVTLVIAILAIRFQDAHRKQNHRYNCRTEAQKMLHTRSSPINSRHVVVPMDKNTNLSENKLNNFAMTDPDFNFPLGENNIQMGSCKPDNHCSRTSSFQETVSLGSQSLNLDRGHRARASWSSATQENQNRLSSDQHRPVMPGLQIPQTEIGGFQGAAPMFPAHSAAVNKHQLSPVVENVQMQPGPRWGSQRLSAADPDADSASSGEMSNTDSGRGGSEEGESHALRPRLNTHTGTHLASLGDSDIQGSTIGCHGNTGPSVENQTTRTHPHGKNIHDKYKTKPTVRVLDVSSKGPQSHNRLDADRLSADERNSTRDHKNLNIAPLNDSQQTIPVERKAPPRPPRSYSLSKDPSSNYASNNGSQRSSVIDMDDHSSTTSGSYMVDHDDDDITDGHFFSPNHHPVCDVTMKTSHV